MQRSPSRPFGVVLAGGLSRRMGRNKADVMLGGETLLARAIARLAPQVEGLAINANHRVGEASGHPIIADTEAGHLGPLAGVLAGMDWAAAQGADSIVTVAVDTPFFPSDLVARLSVASEGMAEPMAYATRGGARHPVFAQWPCALRDDLRAALRDGTRRVSDWAEAHGARPAPFPEAGRDPFFNINTPDDLTRAAEWL